MYMYAVCLSVNIASLSSVCRTHIMIGMCMLSVSVAIIYVLCTEQGKLEEMVNELSMGLAVIKHEQEYMEVRERIHRMSECVHLRP